jgi:protein TonB
MPYQGQNIVARRNPAGIALVIALHVVFVFVFALLSGLKVRQAEPLPQPMTGEVLPVNPKSPEPPPLNTTQPLARIDVSIDKRLPPVELAPATDDTLTEQPPPVVSGPGTNNAPGHEAVLAPPAVDPHYPLTQPPYPPAAIRSGAQGKLALQVLVATDGRVRDARVLETSGFATLDQAALEEARRHWKLRPGTRDGIPFEQWYTLRVVFHLKDRP